MSTFDLHIHTLYSDGELTPERIVDLAIDKGIEVIAITDHDTIEGYKIAKKYANGKRIKILSGIEFSTSDSDNVHILGYGISCDDEEIMSYCDEIKKQKAHELVEVLINLKRKNIKINTLGKINSDVIK